MGRYLARRIFSAFVSLILLVVLSFLLLRAFPGSPFADEPNLSPQTLALLQEKFHLNQSWLEQLLFYIKGLVTFDLGPSLAFTGKSVGEVISEGAQVSFVLGFFTLITSLLAACFLIWLRFRFEMQNSIRNLQWILISLPNLLVAPLVIWFFGFFLDWLPVRLTNDWLSFVLPTMVLSIRPTANISRLVITSLEKSLKETWAINKLAYGFSDSRVAFYHALKLSLAPLLAYMGTLLAHLFSGSLIVEYIFSANGLGTRFIEGLLQRDYILLTTLILLFGFILVIANAILDLILYKLDPRIEVA